jgi:hypothetical protein
LAAEGDKIIDYGLAWGNPLKFMVMFVHVHGWKSIANDDMSNKCLKVRMLRQKPELGIDK